MKVFVDTSAWIALEAKSDRNHEDAKKYFGLLSKKRALIFTNDYILAETYTRLIYDFGLKIAEEFRQKITRGMKENLAVLEVDESERGEAWSVLHKYFDHMLSFADATVVANFNEFNLDVIFTFDRHFRDINLPTNLT